MPKGWAIPVNHARAVDWYKKAAEAGHVAAMTALADYYRNGPRNSGERRAG
jgi:TPR repeat protein